LLRCTLHIDCPFIILYCSFLHLSFHIAPFCIRHFILLTATFDSFAPGTPQNFIWAVGGTVGRFAALPAAPAESFSTLYHGPLAHVGFGELFNIDVAADTWQCHPFDDALLSAAAGGVCDTTTATAATATAAGDVLDAVDTGDVVSENESEAPYVFDANDDDRFDDADAFDFSASLGGGGGVVLFWRWVLRNVMVWSLIDHVPVLC
jgi:hypothetical protein